MASLFDHLGGWEVAGGKLKETGLEHWLSPNLGADNSSGFQGLAGGIRFDNGQFGNLGVCAIFWSTTISDIYGDTWKAVIYYNLVSVGRGDSNPEHGFSVRCLKD